MTTNMFLAKGIKEGNPLVKWSIDTFGSFWWAPKMGIALLSGAIGTYLAFNWTPIGASVIVVIPALMTLCLGVYQNVQQLRKYS